MVGVEREQLVDIVVKLLRLKPERRKEIEAKVDAEEGLTLKRSRIDVAELREALKRTDAAASPSIGTCAIDASIHGVMPDVGSKFFASGALAGSDDSRDVRHGCCQCPRTPLASDENDPAFGNATAAPTKDEDTNAEHDVSAVQGKRSAQIFVDISKTGRSTCRVCDERIALGSVRCGQDKFSSGITKTGYTHALCFLRCASCDYAPAKRGKCQSSEYQFARGDLRVKFDAVKTTYWLPEEAGKQIGKILEALRPTPHLLADAVVCLNDMEGLHDLELHHAEIVSGLLLGTVPPPRERLRSTHQTPVKRLASESHGGDCIDRKSRRCLEADTAPQPRKEILSLASTSGFDASEQPLEKRSRPVFLAKLSNSARFLDLT